MFLSDPYDVPNANNTNCIVMFPLTRLSTLENDRKYVETFMSAQLKIDLQMSLEKNAHYLPDGVIDYEATSLLMKEFGILNQLLVLVKRMAMHTFPEQDSNSITAHMHPPKSQPHVGNLECTQK